MQWHSPLNCPPFLPLSLRLIYLYHHPLYLSSIIIFFPLNLVTLILSSSISWLSCGLFDTLAPGSPHPVFLSQALSADHSSSELFKILVSFPLLRSPWIILTALTHGGSYCLYLCQHMALQFQSLSGGLHTHFQASLGFCCHGLYYSYLKFCMSNRELCLILFILVKLLSMFCYICKRHWVNWTLYKYFIKVL